MPREHMQPDFPQHDVPDSVFQARDRLAQQAANYWPGARVEIIHGDYTRPQDSFAFDVRFDDENGRKLIGFLVRVFLA